MKPSHLERFISTFWYFNQKYVPLLRFEETFTLYNLFLLIICVCRFRTDTHVRLLVFQLHWNSFDSLTGVSLSPWSLVWTWLSSVCSCFLGCSDGMFPGSFKMPLGARDHSDLSAGTWDGLISSDCDVLCRKRLILGRNLAPVPTQALVAVTDLCWEGKRHSRWLRAAGVPVVAVMVVVGGEVLVTWSTYLKDREFAESEKVTVISLCTDTTDTWRFTSWQS